MRMPKPLLNELKTMIAQNVLPKEINDILKTKLKRLYFSVMAKPKKKPTIATVLLPLITIPIVILLDIGLIALGGFLDVTMYDPKPGTIGTPVPFFTAIFGVIAGILSLIGFIVMIVLMIVGAVRLSKSSKED